jgi:ubiquinone/menaquinone biosynthesis C-methylase UbiE
MDHGEVNRWFVEDLLAAGPGEGEILDLGTGTALIPVELCRQSPTAKVRAVDLAEHMLRLGRKNVEAAGLADRIALQRIDAKRLPYGDGRFATVVSNSIVHHIPEPRDVFAEAWRVTAPGGLLFFRDLLRPEDDRSVRRLVDAYAGGANRRQRKMFEDSLRAALTVEEVRSLVAEFGAAPETVFASSEHRWTWIARVPVVAGGTEEE